jgi:DNA-binding protein HU-beta
MTKQDLVNQIAQKIKSEKTIVGNTVEAFMEIVKDNMSKGENIYLRGFGTFEVKKRAKKTARNITKGTAVIVPEHFIPAFKACDEFKEAVKKIKI